MIVRPAESEDAEALARIYNHYVRDTVITFEEDPVPNNELGRRLERIRSIPLPWLVATRGGNILGYAYASPWKTRRAYRTTVEVTVYVDPASARRGVGSTLYGRLLPALRDHGIHVALGGIALPNPASVALHESFGFVEVGRLREVGFKLGRWVDVGYWQATL